MSNVIERPKKSTEELAKLMGDVEQMVWYLARKLHRQVPHTPLEDIASETRLGIFKAAIAFNPDIGTRWPSFAYNCGLRHAIEFVRKEHGRGLSTPNNRNIFDLPKRKSDQYLDTYPVYDSSHDLDAQSDKDRESDTVWKNIGNRLSKRELYCLRANLMGQSMVDIGRQENVSRSMIFQIVKRAIEKLKDEADLIEYLIEYNSAR